MTAPDERNIPGGDPRHRRDRLQETWVLVSAGRTRRMVPAPGEAALRLRDVLVATAG